MTHARHLGFQWRVHPPVLGGLKKVEKKEEVPFFYNKEATLGWDPCRSGWVEGYDFLNYTMKFGRGSIVNKIMGMTRVVGKWQSYLMGNYKFYLS